ncbi:Zn-dependent alcohol dehydrogenase [Spongiactinospora sp. 9N601]|uniref:Zn-dependent alcohol dehydrogenase n=1 Tax=Spongiactinospora sp. 9N601 TaxID=3375149 RepID=UPI0037BA61D5
MRAALVHAVGGGVLDIRDDVTLAPIGPGDVRVRMRATGVCHSDLSVLSGVLPQPLPIIPGHEGSGEVVEAGEHVTGLRPGDRVIISWTPPCGGCAMCLRGQPYLCATFMGKVFSTPRFRFGGEAAPAYGMAGCGTWAEEIVVPWQGAIKVDPDVPYEVAALIGCAVTTGVGAVLNTAEVRPGATVAVIGCGGVGLSVVQGARLSGATTILAVDPLPAKRDLARRLGATDACAPGDLEETLANVTGGTGVDHAFEVVGTSTAIRSAWKAARRGGDVIVVGAGASDDMFSVSAFNLLFEGKNLLSSVYGGADVRRDFPYLTRLWKAGRLDLESLISARIKLSDLNEAVTALTDGEVLRQMVLLD